MKDKIRDFLDQVGYDTRDGDGPGLDLLRYFEDEYGVSLMGMLEKEWLEEQAEQDFDDVDFSSFREKVSASDREAYDRDVALLFGQHE